MQLRIIRFHADMRLCVVVFHIKKESGLYSDSGSLNEADCGVSDHHFKLINTHNLYN